MANEITLNLNASISNSGLKDQFLENIKVTQNVVGASCGVAVVTTSAANIDFGSLATAGYCMLKNLDATNYVQWGQDNASTIRIIGRLYPGEIALFRLEPSTNLRMIAHTAS